jgi:hypothetical protein
MIADGVSLKDILNNLCCSTDVEASSVIAAVLWMDPDGETPLAYPQYPCSTRSAAFLVDRELALVRLRESCLKMARWGLVPARL